MRRPFVICDRDGTLIRERHYLADPDQVELLPGALGGLRDLREQGFGLVVVTNQSGLGRGYFDRAALDRVHQRLTELLSREGITLEAIHTCPHHPDEGCDCRKPRPGLVLQAARELDFKPADCVVIGDKVSDIELARSIGAVGILVRTGYGAETERVSGALADAVVDDLVAAARFVRERRPIRGSRQA